MLMCRVHCSFFVIVEDCRVFRTKARAPSLIVVEVEMVEPLASPGATGGVLSLVDGIPLPPPPALTRRPSTTPPRSKVNYF